MGEEQSVQCVSIGFDDLRRMTEEIVRLRQQVDELQARGTKLMMERQATRNVLRDVVNFKMDEFQLRAYAKAHLDAYPT